MRKYFAIVLLLAVSTIAMQAGGGRGNVSKMSSYVRRAATEHRQQSRRAPASEQRRQESICAFVRVSGDGSSELTRHGCRVLARFDDIYIADIPLDRLTALSESPSVSRIEASESCTVQNDTSALIVGMNAVRSGQAPLPQAFTGRGVVIGVEDIGFDVTHPTFYSRDLSEYRIKRLWDQLSPDTLDSPLYVGRDYRTQEEILSLGHTYDGIYQTHGTHTAGTAAGSGYNSLTAAWPARATSV